MWKTMRYAVLCMGLCLLVVPLCVQPGIVRMTCSNNWTLDLGEWLETATPEDYLYVTSSTSSAEELECKIDLEGAHDFIMSVERIDTRNASIPLTKLDCDSRTEKIVIISKEPLQERSRQDSKTLHPREMRSLGQTAYHDNTTHEVTLLEKEDDAREEVLLREHVTLQDNEINSLFCMSGSFDTNCDNSHGCLPAFSKDQDLSLVYYHNFSDAGSTSLSELRAYFLAGSSFTISFVVTAQDEELFERTNLFPCTVGLGPYIDSYWVCNNIPHCPPVFHFEYEAFPSFADEDECLVADDTSTMTSELNWGLVLAYASAAFTVLFVGSVFLRLDWVAREIRSRRRVYLTGAVFFLAALIPATYFAVKVEPSQIKNFLVSLSLVAGIMTVYMGLLAKIEGADEEVPLPPRSSRRRLSSIAQLRVSNMTKSGGDQPDLPPPYSSQSIGECQPSAGFDPGPISPAAQTAEETSGYALSAPSAPRRQSSRRHTERRHLNRMPWTLQCADEEPEAPPPTYDEAVKGQPRADNVGDTMT